MANLLQTADSVRQILAVGHHAVSRDAPGFWESLEKGDLRSDVSLKPQGQIDLRGFDDEVWTDQFQNVHIGPLGVAEKVAKSGDTQNGQSRAKQAERPGVCNEHVPPAKAKRCSELGRNVERSAEMTGPKHVNHDTEFTCLVTECNTDYLFFRYAPRRNFTPLDRVQSINQDAIVQLMTFAGNLTCSNFSLQGTLKA